MFDLTGKTALITGATGGIGRQIAKKMHAQGATLALTDMNMETLKAFQAELGDRVFVYSANLTDSESLNQLVKQAEAIHIFNVMYSTVVGEYYSMEQAYDLIKNNTFYFIIHNFAPPKI